MRPGQGVAPRRSDRQRPGERRSSRLDIALIGEERPEVQQGGADVRLNAGLFEAPQGCLQPPPGRHHVVGGG